MISVKLTAKYLLMHYIHKLRLFYCCMGCILDTIRKQDKYKQGNPESIVRLDGEGERAVGVDTMRL